MKCDHCEKIKDSVFTGGFYNVCHECAEDINEQAKAYAIEQKEKKKGTKMPWYKPTRAQK